MIGQVPAVAHPVGGDDAAMGFKKTRIHHASVRCACSVSLEVQSSVSTTVLPFNLVALFGFGKLPRDERSAFLQAGTEYVRRSGRAMSIGGVLSAVYAVSAGL